jgi:lysophospholipase L1-like esterase
MLSAPDYRDLMCLDGIHPNEEGYKYMATIWEQELPKIKKEF